MSNRVSSVILAVYLLLCLILGGASAAGYWANLLLQLLAILLIAAALAVRPRTPPTRSGRRLLTLLVLGIGVILIQLVPLPPSLWTLLPGREGVAEGFAMLGEPLPWLPVSLAPTDTIASALWLLPAIAVLLWILKMGARESLVAWVMAGMVVLSVLAGAMQISSGEAYFYRITNYGVNVGFFANANHLAAFLIVTVPFLGALYMAARSRGRSAHKSAGLAVILGGLYALSVVGLAINGSLAGLGLMLPVTGATLLLMRRRRGVPVWAIALVALLAAGSVGAVMSDRFDNNLISAEARDDTVSRYTTFTLSLKAAGDFFPFGSGIGTFQPIYRLYEDPERVTMTYINHVHSDWIEIALETGLLGILVLLLFLIWWGRRTVAIWRSPEPDYFARAATIATAAILAHSLVEYPLRTAAISAIFAACCAFMASGRSGAGSGRRAATKRPVRHMSAE